MARVNLNKAQIILTAQFYTLPLVLKTGQEIRDGAAFLAPEGDHLSGSGKVHKGTPLRQSIYTNRTIAATQIRMRIGAKADHAMSEHQGSKAHFIRSNKGKMLKFRWERGDFLVAARAGRRRGNRRTGQFHFFVSVRHPGNKRPVRFLTTPLEMFGRINGFAVSSTRTVNRTFLP